MTGHFFPDAFKVGFVNCVLLLIQSAAGTYTLSDALTVIGEITIFTPAPSSLGLQYRHSYGIEFSARHSDLVLPTTNYSILIAGLLRFLLLVQDAVQQAAKPLLSLLRLRLGPARHILKKPYYAANCRTKDWIGTGAFDRKRDAIVLKTATNVCQLAQHATTSGKLEQHLEIQRLIVVDYAVARNRSDIRHVQQDIVGPNPFRSHVQGRTESPNQGVVTWLDACECGNGGEL